MWTLFCRNYLPDTITWIMDGLSTNDNQCIDSVVKIRQVYNDRIHLLEIAKQRYYYMYVIFHFIVLLTFTFILKRLSSKTIVLGI